MNSDKFIGIVSHVVRVRLLFLQAFFDHGNALRVGLGLDFLRERLYPLQANSSLLMNFRCNFVVKRCNSPPIEI